MYIDNYGTISMEQCEFPGSIGDSAAESGRYAVLAYINGNFQSGIKLQAFLTPSGVIRHPQSPWGVSDTSTDQIVPLIAASTLLEPKITDTIIQQIKDNGYKVSNGNLINPGVLANIKRHTGSTFQSVYDIAFLGQAFMFKLPFRWSESKHWFEKTEGSSSDYLNFTNGLLLAKIRGGLTFPQKLTLKLIKKEEILQKIKNYYKPEPNSEWLIKEYEQALEKLYNV